VIGDTLGEFSLRERIAAFLELSGSRLLREIRNPLCRGYNAVKDFLRAIRSRALQAFERRFKPPPRKPAQVDFAYFAAFISALRISGMSRTSYEALRLAG
jgi:hypothetical protein